MPGAYRSAKFQRVQELHQRLLERAKETSASDFDAVLNLGAAVLLHGTLEATHLDLVWNWVDPNVRVELENEHGELAHDLDFLTELSQTDPGSEDLILTAKALSRRLKRHIERDERILYRPLSRYVELEREERSGQENGPRE